MTSNLSNKRKHDMNNPGDYIITLKEASSRKTLLKLCGPLDIVFPKFIRSIEAMNGNLPKIELIYEKFMNKTFDKLITGLQNSFNGFQKELYEEVSYDERDNTNTNNKAE